MPLTVYHLKGDSLITERDLKPDFRNPASITTRCLPSLGLSATAGPVIGIKVRGSSLVGCSKTSVAMNLTYPIKINRNFEPCLCKGGIVADLGFPILVAPNEADVRSASASKIDSQSTSGPNGLVHRGSSSSSAASQCLPFSHR